MVSPAYTSTCQFCNRAIPDTRAPHVFQWIEGWVENRVAGGANTIALAHRKAEFVHKECVQLRRMGISPDQEALWPR